MQDKAAERRLDMAGRAAKTVVQIEMAESGLEIVAPEQAHHPTAEPHAFGIAGRTGDLVLDFGVLVDRLRRLLPSRDFLVRGFGVGGLGLSRMTKRSQWGCED